MLPTRLRMISSGVVFLTLASISCIWVVLGVLVLPGWMQLTRTPSFPNWLARLVVRLEMPALMTPLGVPMSAGDLAAVLPMFIIRPPPRRCMWGITSLVQRT